MSGIINSGTVRVHPRLHPSLPFLPPSLRPSLPPSLPPSFPQDSLQARFLQFWHQTSRSSVVSAHLSMLEEAIAEEERRMADLDRELRDRGLDLQAVDGERTIVDPPVNDSSSPTVQR